jgi:hypothetical protein
MDGNIMNYTKVGETASLETTRSTIPNEAQINKISDLDLGMNSPLFLGLGHDSSSDKRTGKGFGIPEGYNGSE